MFSWFNANEAQLFATTLADYFIERIPPDGAGKREISQGKKQEVLNKMLMQIERFKASHALNIYKKARLANTFKWKLLDANYETGFVDELTQMLLTHI